MCGPSNGCMLLHRIGQGLHGSQFRCMTTCMEMTPDALLIIRFLHPLLMLIAELERLRHEVPLLQQELAALQHQLAEKDALLARALADAEAAEAARCSAAM